MFDITSIYKVIIGIVVTLGLLATVYFIGYNHGKDKCQAAWDEEKTAAQLQVDKAQQQINVQSDKTVTQYVDRWNTLKEKEYVYVDTAKGRVPGQHDVSNGWVYLHDKAATADNADPAIASDDTPSGIKDNQALAVVVSNYARCLEDKNKLIALQTWVTDTKKAVDEANSKDLKNK